MVKPRLLTGHRPTGPRHLGHLVGTLRTWARVQDEYDCFFLVADWHVLTTDYRHTERISPNIRETLWDWLAAGVDPGRSAVFLQSAVPEHAELTLLFGMLVTVARLERNPTYKEQKKELHLGGNASLGLLEYPVLQAADVLMYLAERVPVGEDQLPHLELTREIARRFNSLYGALFPEPEAMLSETPRLAGLDGRTMHTSYGNVIWLSEKPEDIRRKVAGMITDPQRIYASTPGRPDVCSVFAMMQAVLPDRSPVVAGLCQAAEIGCVPCKAAFAQQLIDLLEPFRRIRTEASPERLEEILREGTLRARPIAAQTMGRVREMMHLDFLKKME